MSSICVNMASISRVLYYRELLKLYNTSRNGFPGQTYNVYLKTCFHIRCFHGFSADSSMTRYSMAAKCVHYFSMDTDGNIPHTTNAGRKLQKCFPFPSCYFKQRQHVRNPKQNEIRHFHSANMNFSQIARKENVLNSANSCFHLTGLKNNGNKVPVARRYVSFTKNCCRKYDKPRDYEEELKGDDELLDLKYRDMYTENYLLPDQGHNVFVIQPDFKMHSHQARSIHPDLQLAEACALVASLPRWRVAQQIILPLKNIEKKYLYGKGNFAMLKHTIRQTHVTAVFVSINMLSPKQFATLQKEWGVPVYDRYTMVLQIFKLRALTKEAKLQVALAEIPYYRSCLRGFHEGTLDQQRGGMQYIGGTGETFMEVRSRLLQERETKVKRALSKLRDQRQLLRRGREKHHFPIVAVVGYTNAGKTSLIKALTKDASMEPRDQLFATLDVTTHAGKLDNNMTVLYVDTVGFISDIPTDLIESFAATLEDMLNADVVIHVRDESHPDKENQNQNVLETLDSLKLPSLLRKNIIEVANKADLLPSHDSLDDDLLYISATTGQGLQELRQKIQEVIMLTTDRVRKHLLVPMNGEHLSWLYKEATVESCEPSPNNPEALMVSVVMTSASFARFKSTFGKGNKTSKSREKTL